MNAEFKTTTVESLLGVLSLGPMSGYAMRQFMEQSTANFWSESFGQIYPALKKMVADGLVEAEEGAGDGHPARKVYRLTVAGAAHLREWLGVPARPRGNRNELLLKVFFGNQTEPHVIAGLVAGWKAVYAADLARYEAIAVTLQAEQSGHPGLPFWLMTLRYGIAEARALSGWCEETMAELEKQALSIRD